MHAAFLTRFRLLLIHDIGWFLFFIACAIPSRRIAYATAIVIVSIAKHAGLRAQHIDSPLSTPQRRARAAITVIGYISVIAGMFWLGGSFSDPGIWVVVGLIVPVALVFCYVQVRLQLGLEPSMQGNEPQAPNQAMQRTAGLLRRAPSPAVTDLGSR